MNKLIKGRRYDTDTAQLVTQTGTLNLNYEALYRKKNGEYFLYLVSEPGEKIQPLTLTQAKRWAGKILSHDECEKIFQFPKDAGKNSRIMLYVPPSMHEALKQQAVEHRMTMNEYIVNFLRDNLL